LFGWTVSEFGLNDVIEAGLVKAPRVVCCGTMRCAILLPGALPLVVPHLCLTPRNFRRAVQLRPDLYRRHAQIERRIGHTHSPSVVRLPELTGISPAAAGLNDLTGLIRA